MKPTPPKPKYRGPSLKNRIVGREMVAAKSLKPHPMNARIHPEPQRKALAAVLDQVGWVQDVIVNKTTGYILNGHLRVEIAVERNEEVPVVYVQLSAKEEKLILAALDPVGEMALVDDAQLSKLLGELELPTDSELGALLGSLLEETIQDVPRATAGAVPAAGRTPRQLGDRKAQIKPVLYAGQVQVFEEAIRLTGELNRGKALMKICEFYVAATGDA